MTQPTNDNRLPFQQLHIYKAAKELARRVHFAQIRDAELREDHGEIDAAAAHTKGGGGLRAGPGRLRGLPRPRH